MSTRGVAILGSTGSIGCNTLRVIESLGSERFRIVALGAGRNVARLADQITQHQPELVSVDSEESAQKLKAELTTRNAWLPRIVIGEAGLVEVATHDRADYVVSGTVGAVGFVPTLRALETGKRVALANKETLVMAGGVVSCPGGKHRAPVVSVRSRHNGLHPFLRGEKR